MVTYCVSPDCVALLLDPEEPLELCPAVSATLRLAGFAPWQEMEGELYSGTEGRLLIARPCPPHLHRCSGTVPRLRRA